MINKQIEDLMYKSGLTAQGCWVKIYDMLRVPIDRCTSKFFQKLPKKVRQKSFYLKSDGFKNSPKSCTILGNLRQNLFHRFV